MAVRFDAGTDRLTSNGTLVSGSAFSVLCWAYLATDRNALSCIWGARVSQASGNYKLLQTTADGTTVGLWTTGSYSAAPFGGTAVTVGGWWRFGVAINGAAMMFLRGAAGSSPTVSSVTDAGTGPTLSAMQLNVGASQLNTTDFWDGRVANLKVYSAALTSDEMEQELSRYVPFRTNNLERWHPWTRTVPLPDNNYAGTVGGFTVGSTPVTQTEDGPPIPWFG